MRKQVVCFVAVLLLWGSLPLQAQITETHSFTSLNQAIPGGNASGLHDVRAITSAIPHLASVRLKMRIAGEFNGDLYGYLRHIQGSATNFCVLLNRVGRTAASPAGYADAGLEVLLARRGAAGGYSPLSHGNESPGGNVTDRRLAAGRAPGGPRGRARQYGAHGHP